MSFLSFEFLAFCATAFLLYWQVPSRFRPSLLILASLGFYALNGSLVHLLVVVVINWYLVLKISTASSSNKRRWLSVGVSLNLLHLIFFKYTNSLLALPAVMTLTQSDTPILKVVQPLAVSFYTFQVIGFLTDVFRGEVKELSFRRFLLFMTFFPHMIAGPILRSKDFYAAIGNEQETNENMTWGSLLVILGIFKKAVLADALAAESAALWQNPSEYTAATLLLAAGAYSAQLYLDFSGLIDICRGVGRLFGYELPRNFNAPYFSQSFGEIWKRWHITLSNWIRDYLYIPLGGNRVSSSRASLNLLMALTLSGIWHGDTWNFFIWGFLHGLFLLAEKAVGLSKAAATLWGATLRRLYVFVVWSAAFVFFRAPDLTHSVDFFGGLLGGGEKTLDHAALLRYSAWAFLLHLAVWYLPAYRNLLVRYRYVVVPLAAIVVLVLLAMSDYEPAQFIYHQF